VESNPAAAGAKSEVVALVVDFEWANTPVAASAEVAAEGVAAAWAAAGHNLELLAEGRLAAFVPGEVGIVGVASAEATGCSLGSEAPDSTAAMVESGRTDSWEWVGARSGRQHQTWRDQGNPAPSTTDRTDLVAASCQSR